jgi:hypothetical protein
VHGGETPRWKYDEQGFIEFLRGGNSTRYVGVVRSRFLDVVMTSLAGKSTKQVRWV